MSIKISDGLELETQLPLPNLNTKELMKHLFETGQVISVKVNGISYEDCKLKSKPLSAVMVLSLNILSDVKDTPINEITSNGDVICRNNESKPIKQNAKGLNFKMKLPVQIKILEYGKYGVYVDSRFEAYDIINLVLINQDVLPAENSQAIKIRLDVLEKNIIGSVFSIEIVKVNGKKEYYHKVVW